MDNRVFIGRAAPQVLSELALILWLQSDPYLAALEFRWLISLRPAMASASDGVGRRVFRAVESFDTSSISDLDEGILA